MLPQWSPGKCHVYVFAIDANVVKVGITDRPRERMRQHWKNTAGGIRWVHLFPACTRPAARESELLAPDALRDLAVRINRSEWYESTASKAEIVFAMRRAVAEAAAKHAAIAAAAAEVEAAQARIRSALDAAGMHDIGGHLYVPKSKAAA